MKVKCIDQGDNSKIEVGRIYDVIEEDRNEYLILNNVSEEYWYKASLFEQVAETPIGPPNCTKCGEYNSYQTGPFICYRCRS